MEGMQTTYQRWRIEASEDVSFSILRWSCVRLVSPRVYFQGTPVGNVFGLSLSPTTCFVIGQALKRAKSDSKLPRRVDVIQGFDDLEQDDQDKVRKLVEEFDEQRTEQDAGKGKKKATPKKPTAVCTLHLVIP
jgi:hypothetical protein